MSEANQAPSPLILRARLAEQLRQHRDQAGLSQSAAAGGVSWSVSKLQRIETAVVGISVTDTKALIDLYRVADQRTADQMLTMAKQARRRDRFTPYKKYFSAEYQALLSYEESAFEIRSVNSFVMPGLLQTPDYARALLSVKHSGEKLEALVEARKLRQEILDRETVRRHVFVFDEAMLRRQVGGRDVLLEQVIHLGRLSELANLELRIIPLRLARTSVSGSHS
jgi:predicted XRE-type DNA-binding protein